MEYYEFRAMNTDIVLAAEGEPQLVQTGFERAHQYIEASEARFTRFAETSELSALNRAPGEWLRVSAETTPPDSGSASTLSRLWLAMISSRLDVRWSVQTFPATSLLFSLPRTFPVNSSKSLFRSCRMFISATALPGIPAC